MAYSPVFKSKNKKSDNESLLEDIRSSIDKEYREAVQSDDWSNYEFVYEMYRNYKLNGGNSEYVKSIVKRYQSQYIINGTEKIRRDCISSMASAVLNDMRGAETIEGTELDCHNIAKTVKPKSFIEMSYEEKIKFVNRQIDDLLDFIERNKQAKYNKYKKEFCNECNKL